MPDLNGFVRMFDPDQGGVTAVAIAVVFYAVAMRVLTPWGRLMSVLKAEVPAPTLFWIHANAIVAGITGALLAVGVFALKWNASVLIGGAILAIVGIVVIWMVSHLGYIPWTSSDLWPARKPFGSVRRRVLRCLCWATAVVLACDMWLIKPSAGSNLNELLRARDRVELYLLLAAVELAASVLLVAADFSIESWLEPQLRRDNRNLLRALGAFWTLLLVLAYVPVHVFLAAEADRQLNMVQLSTDPNKPPELAALEIRKAMEEILNTGAGGLKGLNLVSIGTPLVSGFLLALIGKKEEEDD